MTQINFTLNFDQLKEEVMQSSLNDVIKSSIVVVLNKYMEEERNQFMNNASYERDGERSDYRNGYYDRDLVLNIGRIPLKVPRTRSGEFSTQAFEKYSRSDQAFLLSMVEMVVNGVSTRKVSKVVEQLCGEKVSKSMVSDLTKELDPIIKEWSERPLSTDYYRYVYVDATYIKVREFHKVVSKAVYIALGVNSNDEREIIGFKVSGVESKANWSDFFESLISRGLHAPKLIISDAHEGLKSAVQEKFLGSSWQRCTVHFIKNITDAMPKKDSAEARHHLKEIFKAQSIDISRMLKEEFITKFGDDKKYQKAINVLDEGYEDAVQFYTEPPVTHRHIRSTNVLERINGEVKRRVRVIRIFPNPESAFRLVGAVLKDYDASVDSGGRKYFYR
ncbi:IS256 family transposase [Lentibacillus sp. JNUCC-1]|uniref:IS256 family transposase n=1 Tax=Lentibacillus sp. JNUCC-1 TaxID=2654513 RepID=UPI0012E7D879|nr:IS256 family transposase [Lentibacillus sp. JNUCC-1]